MTLQPISRTEIDKEIFFPSWACFCCSDKGIVPKVAMRKLYPEYDVNEHGVFMCTRQRCDAYATRTKKGDGIKARTDLSSQECEGLHTSIKKDWEKTAKDAQERIKENQKIVTDWQNSMGADMVEEVSREDKKRETPAETEAPTNTQKNENKLNTDSSLADLYVRFSLIDPEDRDSIALFNQQTLRRQQLIVDFFKVAAKEQWDFKQIISFPISRLIKAKESDLEEYLKKFKEVANESR